MTSNENKSTLNCLKILIKDLRDMQHGLDPNLQNEQFMQNQLIIVCEEVPACRFACYKPNSTLAGQIIDLKNSIISYEKTHRSENYQMDTENFFTDRRYRGNDRKFQPRQSSSRAFISYRSRPFNSNATYNRRKKKCFVCHKKGCWSNNHTDKKKDETNIKFKNDFIKRYDRRFNQYITDFENIPEMKKEKKDDLNNPNAKMKTFVLNATSEFSFPKIENSETFFTSFATLQDAEIMIINLNQRAFKHGLKITEPLTSHDTETSDPFAYVISDRYISNEFYEIMIDTDASKYSTVDYEQYLAYKTIHEVNIDSTKARTIYVQFGIGSISSIDSIDIATPIDRIEFHIIKADTSFLLCLVDLDRLKVYFNNVDNILISKKKEVSFSVIRRFGHSFFL